MDSIRVSEAPDPGSILGETTNPAAKAAGFFIFERAEFTRTREKIKKPYGNRRLAYKGFE